MNQSNAGPSTQEAPTTTDPEASKATQRIQFVRNLAQLASAQINTDRYPSDYQRQLARRSAMHRKRIIEEIERTKPPSPKNDKTDEKSEHSACCDEVGTEARDDFGDEMGEYGEGGDVYEMYGQWSQIRMRYLQPNHDEAEPPSAGAIVLGAGDDTNAEENWDDL